jgi:hypothetical protein
MNFTNQLKILTEMVDEEEARAFYFKALSKCVEAARMGREMIVLSVEKVGYRELEVAMNMLEEEGLGVREFHSTIQIFWDEGHGN